MKINGVFNHIITESAYYGYPATIIELNNFHYVTIPNDILSKKMIELSPKQKIVLWKGDEALKQLDDIGEVVEILDNEEEQYYHHLETSGKFVYDNKKPFFYICTTPKTEEDADYHQYLLEKEKIDDIRVITDLKFNSNLIQYATILAPKRTCVKKGGNKKVEQSVLEYCIENSIKYLGKIHCDTCKPKVKLYAPSLN